MRKGIILLLLAFTTTVSQQAKAEEINTNQAMNGKPALCSLLTFGLEVGFTMFSQRYSYDGEASNDYNKVKPGFHVAATMMYPLTASLFILTLLDFTMKGMVYNQTSGDYYYKDRLSLFYLQLPILLAYTFYTFQEYTFTALFGPYVALGLFGKYKYESNYPGSEDGSGSTEFGKDNDLRRGDVGLNLGLMVVRGLWTFRIAYQMGLKNVHPNVDSESGIYNRGGNISVGYRFGSH